MRQEEEDELCQKAESASQAMSGGSQSEGESNSKRDPPQRRDPLGQIKEGVRARDAYAPALPHRPQGAMRRAPLEHHGGAERYPYSDRDSADPAHHDQHSRSRSPEEVSQTEMAPRHPSGGYSSGGGRPSGGSRVRPHSITPDRPSRES